MSREIKFRGRTSGSNEWVYGSYQADVMHQGTHTIMYCDYEGYYMEDGVDPETVGQYTGLKDKNGKEIYEGDVVKGYWWENGERHRHIGKVVYGSASFKAVGVKQYKGMADELNSVYEVIGNIHENPELLK